MKLSVIYVTGRREPMLSWLFDGLSDQMRSDDMIEVIVVDALSRTLAELAIDVPSFLTVRVVPVKPNIWQGAHRVTSKDFWALSNARNTGIIYATHDYLAFLDDRCKLGPQWLATVRAGAQTRRSVIAGSYEKYENGKLARDTRLRAAPNGMTSCGGGWLYGCTLALPLDWALGVNGFEEGCDGLSMEDVIFGLNLQLSGRRIDFDPTLWVTQERSVEHANTYRRTDKGKNPEDKSHFALRRFGTRTKTEFTPDLRTLRALVRDGEKLPIPDPSFDYRDWFDGELIREMV